MPSRAVFELKGGQAPMAEADWQVPPFLDLLVPCRLKQ